MAYLYVTTDRFEAETLIEDTAPNQEPKYNYRDLEPIESQNLINRIGFDPMCSVEMNGNISATGLDTIATKLVKEGFYVATEFDGKLKKYFPSDVKVREELVKIALQKERVGAGVDAMGALLLYSNNPSRIKDFWKY